MLAQFVNITWSICQLKRGPQDMPASTAILLASIVVHALIGWSLLSANTPVFQALWHAGVLLLLTLIFTFGVLWCASLVARYQQTLTALFATSALINTFVLPFMVLQPWLFQAEQAQVIVLIATFVYLFSLLILNVWVVLVTAHIYRHALNTSFLVGLLITFLYLAFNLMVFSQISSSG